MELKELYEAIRQAIIALYGPAHFVPNFAIWLNPSDRDAFASITGAYVVHGCPTVAQADYAPGEFSVRPIGV